MRCWLTFVVRATSSQSKNSIAILYFSLLALLVCNPTAAKSPQQPQADQDPKGLKQLSLEQLGGVEVTSVSKKPEDVWKTPAAIFVLTQEDIRRSGATSIPEILRLVPGVEVARIDSDHWSVGVRGFGGEFSKSLLVMIDGRSVYTPLFSGVYWQVQDTLLEDVERIEVIRGPGGTIWGANAVNGVINIITKSAKDTHGAIAAVSGGNVDQGMSEFRYGGAAADKFNYRVYAKGFMRGPESHPDGANFDDWRMGQIGFRTDWNSGERDAFTFQGDAYAGIDGERVAVSSLSPPSVQVLDGAHDTGGGNLLGRWQRQLNGSSDIQLQTYFDRTTRFSPQLDEIRDTFDFDFLYHLKLRGHQDLQWGVGARWSPDKIVQKFATLDFEPHHETDQIYSWYLQDRIEFVPNRFALTVGSKFEHNNYTGFEFQPDARLIWTPTEHQSVWASLTRAVRTPSRLDTDLQLTDFLLANPPIFLRIVGSNIFKSETLIGSEVGYRSLLVRNLYIDLAAFHNNYDDLFGFGPGVVLIEKTPPPTRFVLQEAVANALRGNTAGFEIAPDWKPVEWWELKGSYSYLHLSVRDKPGFTDSTNLASDNGSSPHHQMEVQSLLTLKKFEFDTTLRYVSALPAQTVNAYETADVRLGWHATQNWELSITGQNLLQPTHAEFGTDVNTIVGIERSAYAKIVWRSR
ncbi:MAG TPA: TonB-dependent receptor [Candidatus Acidoferrum sp.]|jgi:iron complex outermembrane receptor protein